MCFLLAAHGLCASIIWPAAEKMLPTPCIGNGNPGILKVFYAEFVGYEIPGEGKEGLKVLKASYNFI